MHTLEEIKTACDLISQTLEIQTDIDNAEGMLAKLNTLSSITGLNATCIAVSIKVYNKELYELTIDSKYAKLKPTEKKVTFNYLLERELEIMKLAERQASAIDKEVNALRTMISYLKSELNNLSGMKG